MSFSKAKLLRFNEETSCAPPPGKYDPKFDIKIKGAVIEKSKRFVDKTIETASVDSCDSASSCSFNPTFRTPQLPRKKEIVTPRSAKESGRKIVATRPGSKTKKRLDDVFRCETESNLIEQINELSRVHSSQLIDKDQEISSLYNELSEVKKTMSKLENCHTEEINSLKQKYEVEILQLKENLDTSCENLLKEKEIHDKTVEDLRAQIKFLEENLKNSNSIYNEFEYQMAEQQLSFIELKNSYAQLESDLKNTKDELQRVTKEKETELKAMHLRYNEEIEGVATAAELNVDNLSTKMEQRLKQLRKEIEKSQEGEQNDLFNKMEQITDEMKEQAKYLDSQTTAVFRAIQATAEKFDGKTKEIIDSMNDCLKMNCDKLMEWVRISDELEAQKASNLEQKIMIVDLQDKVEILEEETAKLRKQCRKYEIVQNEASKTIQVLSKRLYESESEVENLNEIQEELALRKDALEEKVKSVLNENYELKTKIKNLEVSLIQDVMDVERDLISKVEAYQRAAADETVKFKSAIDEKQNTIERIFKEVDFYKNKVRDLQEFKNLCEHMIKEYKEEIEKLSLRFNEVEDQFNKQLSKEKNSYAELLNEFNLIKTISKENEQQLNEKINHLINEKNLLLHDVESKESELSNLKNEMELKSSNMKEEIAALEQDTFEHERHIEELALKLDHYVDCNIKSTQEINRLSKEIEEKEVVINEMRDDINEKNVKIETLSCELTESKNYVQSVTDHVVSLMNELSDKDKQCENLNHDIEVKNATMIQVSEEYEKMKSLHQLEVIKNEELEKDFQDTLRDNEKYVDEIISELVLEKERCTELNQNIVMFKSENEELKKNLSHLEENLGNMTNKENELQLKIDNLEKNELKLNDEIFRLNNINNLLEKNYSDVKDKNYCLENENESLESKINELTGEKDDLVEMVKRQWEEMELLTNEISSQQEQIDELKQAKKENYEEFRAIHQEELQNEIFTLQQNLEDSQQVVNQLKSKEEDLYFKLKGAEAELDDLDGKNKINNERVAELENKISDLELKLCSMEKRKNEYKLYSSELEQDKIALKQQNAALLEEKERLAEENHEESMKYTSLNAQIVDLECRNRELENIIGPFKEQLLQFESERAALLCKTQSTEKELQALALEHAKALGHQNHKQKIKHVVQLTERISDLKKEVEKLRNENNRLRAVILDKESTLKKSGSGIRNKKDNKENGIETSPVVNKQKAERQSSPANPLKTRNVH